MLSVTLQVAAFEAYANRDFQETVGLLTRILNVEPKEARWYEMRAQVRSLFLPGSEAPLCLCSRKHACESRNSNGADYEAFPGFT